ncbi:uncharacterized protein [Hetaerina americana]|uniref:uncharacterized protein n=1 Tax=Hetaerina americana TaxID=62018 RepID=UPI003A7F257B
MDDEDIGRFRSSFARSMVDAVIERSVGAEKNLMTEEDYGTEITSLGSSASWSASWSPLPAASPPQSLSPEPSILNSTRVPSSTNASSTSSTLLQVQIESLNWQLNQMEVSYKMQRVVLQQLLTFLERLPNDLSTLGSESTSRNASHICSKCGSQVFPALGSTRRNSLELSSRNINLCDSPANGLSCTIRPGSSFDNSPLRDISWRRRRRDSSSSTERIGSEAQRLLRTVRSVLAATTPEPNQLLACLSENNSISGRSMNVSTPQQMTPSSPPPHLPLPSGSQPKATNGTSLTEREEEAFRLVSEGGQRLWEGQRAWGGRQNGVRLRGPKVPEGAHQICATPSKSYNCQVVSPLSVNQKGNHMNQCTERLPEEEESGFSSLGSFQEGMKNEGVARGSFHEVGLPDCTKGEGLTVLWV